jgi:hypothetical protein
MSMSATGSPKQRIAHAAADEQRAIARAFQRRAQGLRAGMVSQSPCNFMTPPFRPARAGYAPSRPRCNRGPRAPHSSAATAPPAPLRWQEAPGQDMGCSGTVNTSSTSPASGSGGEIAFDHGRRKASSKAGDRFMRGQRAEDHPPIRIKADLLLRLAQGGLPRLASVASTLPPGKAIWPGWCFRCEDRLVSSRPPLPGRSQTGTAAGRSRRSGGSCSPRVQVEIRRSPPKARSSALRSSLAGVHPLACPRSPGSWGPSRNARRRTGNRR